MGDSNQRHSIGPLGMLLTSAAIPLFMNAYHWIKGDLLKKEKWLILLSSLGILVSVATASLTNRGQPHSLRANLAWPLFVILITIGLQVMARVRKKSVPANRLFWITITIMGIFVISYLATFFIVYLPQSAKFFK